MQVCMALPCSFFTAASAACDVAMSKIAVAVKGTLLFHVTHHLQSH